jgi:hypothetical protein
VEGAAAAGGVDRRAADLRHGDQDYNALGEFTGFVRLHRAGQNRRTQRWHLEAVRFKLHAASVEGS